MYPTTEYTRPIDDAVLECNQYKTNIELRGKEKAVLIAKDRIAYLLEIGHSETAHAFQSMLEQEYRDRF